MGKRRKGKPTPGALVRDTGKAVRTEEVTDSMQQCPSWQVGTVDLDGPFDWRRITRDEAVQVQARLSCLETMTWTEILVEGNRRNHFIQTNRLAPQARKRLSDIRQDDIDHVMSLAVKGKARILGILSNAVLRVLWWDPEHQACPSPLRRT